MQHHHTYPDYRLRSCKSLHRNQAPNCCISSSIARRK
ncbi:hypothetical protein M758_4G165800 [Ceratodon purpureus]|nr:hypothetical protein M758_4G165800 [Ceratodon purpureus]